MLLRLAVILALLATPLAAQDRATLERQFQGWLESTVWPRARADGVSRETFVGATDGLRLDFDLPGVQRASTASRAQTEFAAPARYFRRGMLDGATAVGRAMARRHADTLAATERATGVPGRIVLAVWGRESGYGQAAIPHDAFRVLATRGFLGRRSDYFTDELVALLRIAEAGHAPGGVMRSSWAGALGQPQFMPSSFLDHAADGDGDGRADIWRSEADTIASIASYLAAHGWVSGRDWGFEVTVPPGVACSLEGPDQGRPIADWADLGITRVSGRPFPAHERAAEGYLMMPAGRHGPAFVVTPNFYVLKDYNMSDLYALFVGHVGDRIDYGIGDFRQGWAPVEGLSRGDVAAMQRGLEAEGHDVGGVDGLAGFKTRRSIGRWQAAQGRRATCFPEAGLAAAIAPN